jgi:hypothetical protein
MVFVPFLILVVVCGGWFYVCAAQANRGSGARWLSALAGGVEFTALVLVFRPVVENTRFFYRALSDLGDFSAIMTYIVLPCLIAVFISGLWLRRWLARSAPSVSSASQ